MIFSRVNRGKRGDKEERKDKKVYKYIENAKH
jgi:hypothetical protein